MQHPAYVLPRIPLPRTLVNKECKGLQRISLDDQGEAVAVAVAVTVAVAVVTGTVFSGVGTVFSGVGTGSSTVTVRAGGRGGAASSRLPALMRPRKNPTSNPKSSPTANVRTISGQPSPALRSSSLGLPFSSPSCYPFTRALLTLARLLRAPEARPPNCSTAQDDRCKPLG